MRRRLGRVPRPSTPRPRLIDHRRIGWPTVDRDGLRARRCRSTPTSRRTSIAAARKLHRGHGDPRRPSTSTGRPRTAARRLGACTTRHRRRPAALDASRSSTGRLRRRARPPRRARCRGTRRPPPPPRREHRDPDEGRVLDRLNDGRFDEAGAFLTEDFERVDRRTVVSMPTAPRARRRSSSRPGPRRGRLHPRSPTNRSRSVEIGSSCRGSRCAPPMVTRWCSSTSVEVDETGRASSTTSFDEDALDDAIAELDERYYAGEGAPHAPMLRVGAAVHRRPERPGLDRRSPTVLD